MKKRTLLGIVAGTAIAAISVTTSYAQDNIGAECGCPAFHLRDTIDLSTFVDVNQEITSNLTLTCQHTYIVDKKIYVPNGKTITIMPGTVLQGRYVADPNNASALIIERGGKIMADGKANCPIVMTGQRDNMQGTYSLTNVGDWGGLVIAGVAHNNLTKANTEIANVTAFGGPLNGVGKMEGFNASDNTYRTVYGADSNGVSGFTPNDDDNSGVLRYVSVRHAGADIGSSSAGNELNGISLYSVGRGTKIEYCETVAAGDDNFEFFGGTVDVKHCAVLFGDDDFYDYDLGYSGRGQFLFGIAGDSLTGLHSTDNGFECDADDDKLAPTFLRSHPYFFNCTLVSNGHIMPTVDNTGPAAIMAKELTEGEFYNNIFVNWRSGLHLNEARANSTYGGDAYSNWTDNASDTYINPSYPTGSGTGSTQNAKYHSLIVKNNSFIHCDQKGKHRTNGVSYAITRGTLTSSKNPAYFHAATPATTADSTQFVNDGNIMEDSHTGIDYTWTWNAGHTDFSDAYHFIPMTNITSSITPAAPGTSYNTDGFFDIVNYRGAFDATQPCWLSQGFTQALQMKSFQNLNPTDLNNDGVTNITDFGIMLGKYGQLDK